MTLATWEAWTIGTVWMVCLVLLTIMAVAGVRHKCDVLPPVHYTVNMPSQTALIELPQLVEIDNLDRRVNA